MASLRHLSAKKRRLVASHFLDSRQETQWQCGAIAALEPNMETYQHVKGVIDNAH